MDDEHPEEDTQTAPTGNLADEAPGTRSGVRRSRKRTKTGCLTCRRRRIKCGEERPTCGNCVKSKRQCEGYNQRVIFKDPLGTYRGPTSATQTSSSFNARTILGPSASSQHSQFYHMQHLSQPLLPSLVRNLGSCSQNQVPSDPISLPGFLEQRGEASDRKAFEFFPQGDTKYGGTVNEIPGPDFSVETHSDTLEPSHIQHDPGIVDQQMPSKSEAHSDLNSIIKHDPEQRASQRDNVFRSDWSTGIVRASEPLLQELVYHSDIRGAASALLAQSYRGNENWSMYLAARNRLRSKFSPYLPSRSITADPGYEVHLELPNRLGDRSGEESHQLERESHGDISNQNFQKPAPRNWTVREELTTLVGSFRQNPTPLHAENEILVVDVCHDDQIHTGYNAPGGEIFDKLDDETGSDDHDHDAQADLGKSQYDHLKNNDLGIIVALQASQDRQDQRLRTYHSFLDHPDALTTYQPSARSSPLNDSTVARIFYHFVNVTGLSISLYERHPANPSLMFQGRPVPRSLQHIWAYTMPTLALNDHALLHAMLAVSSLHISLLQNVPITPALKHYHIAIRRVANSVRLPTRRGLPAILAATLLLGWYELMSGSHQRWSSHLLGATQLLKEVDFAGITKFLKSKKLQQRQARYGNLYHHDMALGIVESRYEGRAEVEENPKCDDVNEGLVGMIMGKKLRYDEYGQVLEDLHSPGNQHRIYTQREIETYETQRDVFWWYCKQDAYQSILSGNRLFMQYDWWSHCPPRAAIGKRDATYGTLDHLILLLGRVAEFGAKDLKRKRKVMQVNGGQWRPTPGVPITHSPTGENAPSHSGPPQIPSFAGMVPGAGGKTKLPRGFSPTRDDSPTSDDDSRNLEDWTVEVEEEWHEIRTAFSFLEENFGPDFQPLGPEHCQLIESPFGPALQYRTYSIAGIWITYYMSLILCHRYHPSMPPAATIAAGIAARQTGFYANEIGRINAAIAPNTSQVGQISTLVGAGLIESTMGLFIAGIQYQNPAQRTWLINRCLDIKRLTGWQTVEAIAMGCETAWTKTAEMGRGPPYTRVIEQKIDQEVWYNTRRTGVVSPEAQDQNQFSLQTDRVHYALGLIGVQQDLENLEFEGGGKATLV